MGWRAAPPSWRGLAEAPLCLAAPCTAFCGSLVRRRGAADDLGPWQWFPWRIKPFSREQRASRYRPSSSDSHSLGMCCCGVAKSMLCLVQAAHGRAVPAGPAFGGAARLRAADRGDREPVAQRHQQPLCVLGLAGRGPLRAPRHPRPRRAAGAAQGRAAAAGRARAAAASGLRAVAPGLPQARQAASTPGAGRPAIHTLS